MYYKIMSSKINWLKKIAFCCCISLTICLLLFCSPKLFTRTIKEPRNDKNSEDFKSVIKFKNINLTYQMDIPEEVQCPPGKRLLILMMSRWYSFETREQIRQNWAKDAFSSMVMRFLIADPESENKNADEMAEEKRKLEKEQSKNGDLIVIRGFEDTYGHIHLKWYAGLEWHQQFCPRVDWILKADDDTVVHLPRLDYWIEHKFRGELAKNPASYFGKVWDGMTPIRDNTSKWYVSEHDFPGDVYPKYMSGPTYLASRQAISAIMPHTSEVIGFNMDDILYTGILAQLGNVSVLDYVDHFTFFLPAMLEGNEKFECENGFPKAISMFEVSAAEMKNAYKMLWEQNCPKILPKIQ